MIDQPDKIGTREAIGRCVRANTVRFLTLFTEYQTYNMVLVALQVPQFHCPPDWLGSLDPNGVLAGNQVV